MRRLFIAAITVLLSSTFALAATSAPAPSAPAPGTLSKVIVAPFTEANAQLQPDWINRAIQQSLSDELASLSSVEIVPVSPAVASGPSTAQAKGAGARFIIRGMIQRLNGDLRVTGRVENVAEGKTVGGFKATGPQHQLFAIEDSIARQIKRVLAPMEADAPGLEEARPVAGGPRTLPPQPTSPSRGIFEGSELQRALDDRDYLNRTARRNPPELPRPPIYYPPQQVSYPPLYPGYGYGGGYGGYGYDCNRRDNNVVIVNRGGGNGGGNGGGGGVSPPSQPRAHLQTVQTQRLRNAAVYPGNSGNFIGPTPHRAPRTQSYRTIP